MAKVEKISKENHEGDVVCITYYNGYVFSGGPDGKIKIWDEDLNLINIVNAHDSYIYAIAANNEGKIYSCSCSGSVKFQMPPYNQTNLHELLHCDDPIQALYCDGDILYTGDAKGVVTNWKNDKMLFKFNLVEEVKSLAAEQSLIYTVRDLDVVISDVVSGKSGKYSNKAVMPGKSPLALLGPLVENKRSFLTFADRTGKGLVLVRNLPNLKFQIIWTLQDCHDMIINTICGDDMCLYSAGYDGFVKGWTNLDKANPKPLGEVNVGSCVNQICCGGSKNSIYIAASDGYVRRAKLI